MIKLDVMTNGDVFVEVLEERYLTKNYDLILKLMVVEDKKKVTLSDRTTYLIDNMPTDYELAILLQLNPHWPDGLK